MRENSYKPAKRKPTLFRRLEGKWLFKQNTAYMPTYYLYRLCYLCFLGLVYIWNNHYHERLLYEINKRQPIVDGLRVKYMCLKSRYVVHSKQSAIAKRAALLGIYESNIPPYTIQANLPKE